MIYILSTLLICAIIFFVYNRQKKVGYNSNLENNVDEDLDFAVFNKRQIYDATRQVLESTYVMVNSKNIETIIGRNQLIEERINAVRVALNSELGKIYIDEALVGYQKNHNLSGIKRYQEPILLTADKNERKVFFAKTLLIGFEKHYETEMEHISGLKMKHAIKNRFNKLEEKLNQVNEIVEELTYLDDIKKLMVEISDDYTDMENNIRSKKLPLS